MSQRKPTVTPASNHDGLAAARYLGRRDPRLRVLIRRIGPHRPIITREPFVALVGSILQQQISMSAAAAVHTRFKALCPRGRITPPAVLRLSEDELRGAGLSRRKAEYVRGLAEAFAWRELTARKLVDIAEVILVAEEALAPPTGN